MILITSILLLGFAFVLQTTIVNQIFLLSGTADLILIVWLSWNLRKPSKYIWYMPLISGLLIGIISELPIWLPVIYYGVVHGFVQYITYRVWQTQLMVLFLSVLVGTFVTYGFQFVYLILIGANITFNQAFNLFILPAAVINVLIALPIFGLVGELIKLVSREEIRL